MAQEQVGSLDGRLLRGNIGVKEVPAKPLTASLLKAGNRTSTRGHWG